MFSAFKLGLKQSWAPFARRYATHRELRSRLSARKPTSGCWNYLRVPLTIAAGVVAFDYFVLHRVMDTSVMAPIKRNPQVVLWSIIGLNVAGFLAWRVPGPLNMFMARYCLLQKQPIFFNGAQMIGSAFSHQNFYHLAINMFVLYQFGAPIANWMGSPLFLECYIDSCVLSSLVSMAAPALLGSASMLPSLGASGAVFSCVGVFSYLLPNAKLALWFIPLPIGAWYVFVLTLGYNGLAMIARRVPFFAGAGIDYAGHVGGSLCGILYGWYSRKRMNELRQRVRRSGFF